VASPELDVVRGAIEFAPRHEPRWVHD